MDRPIIFSGPMVKAILDGRKSMTRRIANKIAHLYDYDQVIIIARSVGEGEHVTTYGKDKVNCYVAARIGDFLKFKVRGWGKENSNG